MDFAPAIFAVGDVGAGDANAITDIGDCYAGSKAGTGGVGITAWRRVVIADGFDDQTTMAVDSIDEIDDGGLVGLDGDVEITV
jgi:hypothetical protein